VKNGSGSGGGGGDQRKEIRTNNGSDPEETIIATGCTLPPALGRRRRRCRFFSFAAICVSVSVIVIVNCDQKERTCHSFEGVCVPFLFFFFFFFILIFQVLMVFGRSFFSFLSLSDFSFPLLFFLMDRANVILFLFFSSSPPSFQYTPHRSHTKTLTRDRKSTRLNSSH